MSKTLIALTAALIAAAGTARADDSRLEQARAEYEIGHYEVAFAAFAALADEGQCDAARIASQMARLGRALYPAAFQADAERLKRWQRSDDCPQPVLAAH
jgi:hypothetical protein